MSLTFYCIQYFSCDILEFLIDKMRRKREIFKKEDETERTAAS